MANLSEDIQCTGSDTRPLMLDRTDFAETLAESTEETPQFGPERPRVYYDLNSEEKDWYNADIWATNILLQGLPKDIYTLINHYTDAKYIWDNVKMLFEGSELTKVDRESQLYDDFEHFRQHKEESIHDYYIRETLAESTEGTPQFGPERPRVYSDLNSEERDRYNADIRATNILLQGLPKDIYTLINHYNDAKDIWDNVKMLLEWSELTKEDRESQLYDDFEHFRQHKKDSINDYYVSTLALLTKSYRTFLPQTNNQLRTSSNPRNQATVQDDRVVVQNGQARPGQTRTVKFYNCNGTCHIARNCTQPKRPQNFEYFKDKMLLMQAQENGAEDSDAFDLDVDEAPTAQTMFMANLSSVDPITDKDGPSYDSDILSEVQDHYQYLDNTCAYQEEHVMHDSVQLDHVVDLHSDYTSVGNMILEQVELYERRAKFELTEREQKINEQLRLVISDRNFIEETLKRELHSKKLQLASTINRNKSMVEETTFLKQDFKQKENKLLADFLNMKSLKEKVEDKLVKQDQSLQTVYMLCRPRPLYNDHNKPALYNGHEILKDNHAWAKVHNTEDTLEIAEITRKKMNAKMTDPECA
nr:hypothetical protein [Tanacetum cinerariifolium]